MATKEKQATALDEKAIVNALKGGDSRKAVADRFKTSQFKIDRIRKANGLHTPRTNGTKPKAKAVSSDAPTTKAKATTARKRTSAKKRS